PRRGRPLSVDPVEGRGALGLLGQGTRGTGGVPGPRGHRVADRPAPPRAAQVQRLFVHRLLLGRLMSASSRTYWLTEPCRIRREDGSIRIERADGTRVRIPITDIRDIVAFDHVDINTSAISVLSRQGVIIHVLDHYGNYVGAITPAEENSSAHVIRSQVKLTDLPETKISVGRAL